MWTPTMIMFNPAREALIRAIKAVGLSEEDWEKYEKTQNMREEDWA